MADRRDFGTAFPATDGRGGTCDIFQAGRLLLRFSGTLNTSVGSLSTGTGALASGRARGQFTNQDLLMGWFRDTFCSTAPVINGYNPFGTNNWLSGWMVPLRSLVGQGFMFPDLWRAMAGLSRPCWAHRRTLRQHGWLA